MLHDMHLILWINMAGWHSGLPCLFLLLVWQFILLLYGTV